MDFTDLEKERLQLKISSEGGLKQYIKYGIGSKLYFRYKKNLIIWKFMKIVITKINFTNR